MKKLICHLLLSLVLVGLLAGGALAEEKAMQVSVDPRMELLAVVQFLSGYGERGILTRFDLEYKEDILEYFADYKEHPAVKTFTKMSNNGFTYDAPPTMMLHFSNPPELKKEIPYTKYLKGRAGRLFGGMKMNGFAADLRDFAEESNFMEFYAQQEEFYQEMVRQTQETLGGESYVGHLEDYYRMSQNSYNIILVPLFHPGGYGPRVERGEGIYDIYNIMGPRSLGNEGIPHFGDQGSFRYLAWHEFGHSFVNPTTEEFIEEINQSKALYKPIGGKMRQQAYPSWEISVNEHIVRAVTTRLAYLHLGLEAGEQVQEYEKSRGFAYLDALLESLESFEQNRDQYPTFVDFYPELVKVFDDLAGQELGADFYLLPFDGTVNGALGNKQDVVIILPTNEADQAVEDEIHKFVADLKNRFWQEAMMVTDEEALEQDLTNKVPILFGTVEGNLWLKKYVDQMPFAVTAQQVEVSGKVYEGQELRLITAVPNIFNPDRGMVIYTAQQAQDVIMINAVFHGPTGFVVARGNEAISSGNYGK